MRILVGDDDENVRTVIRTALVRNLGASVVEARNGSECLQELLRIHCDLVLLDVRMPVMDGMETLRAIRRSGKYSQIPTIMLTGTADEALVREAMALGISAYILKPFSIETLINRVRETAGIAGST
jgi:CheY-like chemotaxis protein